MDRIKPGMKHVSIESPGVKALDDTNFEATTGETRAVVSANGVGKLTLVEALAGASSTHTGEVLLSGKKVEARTPMDVKKLGIRIVYQEVDMALYPILSVTENIAQNDMVMRKNGHIVDWKKAYKQGREALDRLCIGRNQVDEHELAQNLSPAQKQMVLIAKTIRSECNFLILNEPTAPLSNTEIEELFRVVKRSHEMENIAILFISRRLNEIPKICRNHTAMRNGKMIDTTPATGETITKEIVEKMLGHKFEENFPKEACQIGDVLFQVEHLSGAGGRVRDVSIQVRKGEVAGVAGLVRARKSKLCKTIFGVYKKTGGEIFLKNRELKIANPSGAVKSRMALVPGERREEGILVNENVSFNSSVACLLRFCTGPFIRRWKVDGNAKRFVKDPGISMPSVRQQVKNLSNGNQQKVAVGKWLAADCDVYIFDEPTKGVDVGAKQDIFHLINEIAKQGNCAIHASCENSELLSLTDRTHIMCNGTVMAELETVNTTEDGITHYSVGGKNNKNGK